MKTKNLNDEQISGLEHEFAGSEALQAEFGGNVKHYVAYKMAEYQGRVGTTNFRDSFENPGENSESQKLNTEKISALEREFAGSEALQTEFGGDVKVYVAFKQAEVQGRLGIVNSKDTFEKPMQMEKFNAERINSLEREFSSSAELQAEFGGDVKVYVAFKQAEVQGRVGITNFRDSFKKDDLQQQFINSEENSTESDAFDGDEVMREVFCGEEESYKRYKAACEKAGVSIGADSALLGAI